MTLNKVIRKRLTMKTRKSMFGLLFVSPIIVGIVFIYFRVLIKSIVYSFGKMDAQFINHFVGFENYKTVLFVNPDFVRDVMESVGMLLINIVVIIIYSIFVSSLINRDIKGKGIIRAFLFLPVIISTGVVSKIQSYDIVNQFSSISNAGGNVSQIANGLLQADMIEKFILSLNVIPQVSGIVVVAIQNIFSLISQSGVQIIIFLAGLQAISPSIYESAYVEGASGWEVFWKITIPMLSPLILVSVVYTVIDSFTNSSNKIIQSIYYYITQTVDYGISAAMAWIYFTLIIFILLIILPLLSRITYYNNH